MPHQNERTMAIHVVSHSETGRLLEHNEDAFALYDVSTPEKADQLGKLYVLADGKGSHGVGKVVSRIAIETIPVVYYGQSTSDVPMGRLQQAFIAADTRIREYANLHPQYTGVATTCTAVVVKGSRLWIAHIGDTRAYLVHCSSRADALIERLTTDHSRVAAQVRVGELSAEHMRHSPDERDILLRALGESEEGNAYPDFVIQDIHSGDTLALCSDGLWSALTEAHIANIVCSMPTDRACEELVRRANEARGDDNISVILLSFS